MNNEFNEKRYAQKMPTDDGDKFRIDFILSNIPDNNLKVLDLGCWDGSYCRKIQKRNKYCLWH
jgi:2-polyprenyl-3-methyl-5-hydroxy-6-metoxy-1,4-benzoquinol methylase